MKKKNTALVTAAFGADWWRIASVTFPILEQYASRIGADFIVLTGRRWPDLHPHWEKFAMAELLTSYERLCWMDADVIISPKAPSIFNVVPADKFGAFDEGNIFVDRVDQLWKDAPFYGIPQERIRHRTFNYFNGGVTVFGRKQRRVYVMPRKINPDSLMPEQTYLNLRLIDWGIPLHDLTSQWNGLHSIHKTSADRKDLFTVHYAGWLRTADWVQTMTGQMERDLKNWD